MDNSDVENLVVKCISSRSNEFPVTNPLVLLKFDFSNCRGFTSFCLTIQCSKNWGTTVFANPPNNYAVALGKPAVKPVARLYNIIRSCANQVNFSLVSS